MTKTATKAAGPASKGLRVTARTDRFSRAGQHFGAGPVTVPLSELTEDQAARIRGESMLVVEEVDIEPPKKG
ncbi:MAG: hypothetical protein ACKVQR_15025 [Aquabacterium sp.]